MNKEMLAVMEKEALSKSMMGCVIKVGCVAFWGVELLSIPWGCEPVGLLPYMLIWFRSSEVNENNSSQRNSLEEGMKPEQRTNSVSG